MEGIILRSTSYVLSARGTKCVLAFGFIRVEALSREDLLGLRPSLLIQYGTCHKVRSINLMVKARRIYNVILRTELYKRKGYLPFLCFSTQEKGRMPNPRPMQF